MRRIFLLTVLIAFPDIIKAECMGYGVTRYLNMQVVSCASADKYAFESIKNKNYTPKNITELKISSEFVSIIEAIPLSDVELITSIFKGSRTISTGKVISIQGAERVRFQISSDVESCKKFYLGKTAVYAIIDGFQCCREFRSNNDQETTAQCLLNLPVASEAEVSLKEE